MNATGRGIISRSFSYKPFAITFLLLIATAPLSFGLGGGFLFDDIQTIVSNKLLKIDSLFSENSIYAALSFRAGHGSRPIPMFSFALHYLLGGGNPLDFKAVNIALHALTTLVLWRLSVLLFQIINVPSHKASLLGLLVAAAWSAHPLQVSTVLYIVQRMQMLSTLFILCTMWAYIRARTSENHVRLFAFTALGFWLLALASKEDALVVPLLTLGIEGTLLHFNCATNRQTRSLKNSYLFVVIMGSAAYLFLALPHFWSWDTYPGRNFNSIERVLTQGRVLTLYLNQILVPIPDKLTFHYDWLAASRGLFSPLETFISWLVLTALLVVSGILRKIRPISSFGIFLFLAANLMTSSPINLELAFEHRNHLPSIGIILTCVDGAAWLFERIKSNPIAPPLTSIFVVMLLAACTSSRAYVWGDEKRFFENEIEIAPSSERAWSELCTFYYDSSNGNIQSPYLAMSIETCTKGRERFVSPLLSYNLIVYKIVKGETPTIKDWHAFHVALREYPASPHLMSSIQALFKNMDHGLEMDESSVAESLKIITKRKLLPKEQYREAAIFIYNKSSSPEDALAILRLAIENEDENSPFKQQLFAELNSAGLEDWVLELKNSEKAKTKKH